jgi:hypothetical protein
VRRLCRHVRQPTHLLVAEELFEPEGTSIPPCPQAFARSRQGDLGARAGSTAISEPALRVRRDEGCLSLVAPGLRVAIRALERRARPTVVGALRTGASSLDRRSLHRMNGRGHGSLPSVLGFHLDRQTVGGRRAQAQVRRHEDAPSPWSARPFTRASVDTGVGARQERTAARRAPDDAPGAPEAAPTDTSRKKTPDSPSVEVAEAGSAP